MENNFSKDNSCKKCPLQFVNTIVLNLHMALVHKTETNSSDTEKVVKSEKISDYQNKSFSETNINKKSISTMQKNSTFKIDIQAFKIIINRKN